MSLTSLRRYLCYSLLLTVGAANASLNDTTVYFDNDNTNNSQLKVQLILNMVSKTDYFHPGESVSLILQTGDTVNLNYTLKTSTATPSQATCIKVVNTTDPKFDNGQSTFIKTNKRINISYHNSDKTLSCY